MANEKPSSAALAQQAVSPAPKIHLAHRNWLLALALVAITFVAYQPVWHAGFIGWDDYGYVTEQRTLRSLGGLARIWDKPGSTPQYYPLVFTSFWVEYHFWKLQPSGYHVVNVLLHGVNAAILWLVLRKLKVPGSWCAGAVFALHPVCVESVAWVTERKNVLSALFYLLAMLAYLRFRPVTNQDPARAFDWRYYPLVLVLFLCALLSKTVTCSLPAVLMLLVWWKAGRIDKRDMLALAPLFLLGIAGGIMTSWMETHYAGVSGADWSLSFVQRCLIAGRALCFYVTKLFWPRNLTFIYPRWAIDARAPWQYLFPAAVLVVLIVLWLLRSRIGKGALVAALCFAGTLVPALGFFAVYPFRYSYVADHFQYLASIALISLAVSAVTVICERAGQWGRHLATLAAAIVLLALGVCTWGQARVYQDFETLWGDTLTKNPQCWMAHLMLGNAFLRTGRLRDAVSQYEQALKIDADYAEAHANLAFALLQMGWVQESIGHYQEALRIKPAYVEAHDAFGSVLFQLGRRQEAMGHWEQALRIKPNDAAAHTNLGTALLEEGRLREAIEHLEQALQINPDYAEVHYALGVALERAGRTPEAIAHYQQAMQLRPDFTSAQNALARLGAGQ